MASILFYQLLILFLVMLAGFVVSKAKILTSELASGMGNILINLTSPCLTFMSFQIKLTDELGSRMVKAAFLSFMLVIIAAVISSVVTLKINSDRRAVICFASTFSNCVFMGFPLINAVFGAEGVIYASVYNIAFTFCVWTYGDFILSGQKTLNLKMIIQKLILNPPLVATYLGLIFLFLRLGVPSFLGDSLNLLGGMTGPISMLILGENISRINFKKAFANLDLYFGIFLKLILIPIVSMIFLKLVPDKELSSVLFVIAAMPSAVMTAVLSDKYNREPLFASELTVLTHVLCIVTVPFLYRFM